MPTYEYECAAGHRYEKREGFDAPATQKCPKCRRVARRVISAPSVVFKGSGFYITDSRKPVASGADGSSGSSEESTSDGKAGAKADGKAEAKPETSSTGETTPKDAPAPPKADKAAAAG
jgi:putative FmdB family regulatory protein